MMFKYVLLLSIFVTFMTPVLASKRRFSFSWGSSSSRERSSKHEESSRYQESSRQDEIDDAPDSDNAIQIPVRWVRGKLHYTTVRKSWEFDSVEECKYRLQTRHSPFFKRNGNSVFYYCELMTKHGVSCNRDWIFTDVLYDEEETNIQAAKDYCEKQASEYFGYSLHGKLKVCLKRDLIEEIACQP